MNKYTKTTLFLSTLLSIIALSFINQQQSDFTIETDYEELYDEGYYDRYNHKKPTLPKDEDYMEGYKDAKKYRY